MVNGKRGDHPYTDVTVYGDDRGYPQVAELVRELHGLDDERIRALVADLMMFTESARDQNFWQERLLDHLKTIRRLASAGERE